MKKTQTQFAPLHEIVAGRQQSSDAKLEILNRARLDALGEMLQASEQCDAADEAMGKAAKVFLAREKAWQKADRAFWAYVKKGGAK